MDLITVMIPAYNAEKYLGRCLDSLLVQTYENIEILVVNDGSKDQTKSICEEYETKDARVRVINQENGGEGAARNTGLREAKGKYLCFVDADDYVKEDFVYSLHRNIEEANVGLAICGFVELKGDTVINKTVGEKQFFSKEQAMEMLLREDMFKGYVWNKIYDLDIVRTHGLQFDKTLAVWTDVLFVFQYLLYVDQVLYDPTPEYMYIYIENSVSHQANHLIGVEKTYSAIRAKEQMVDSIPKEYAGVWKQISVRFVQSSLATIRNIGYLGFSEQSKEYQEKCIGYIHKFYPQAKARLSQKERVLSWLSCHCITLLYWMYGIKK